MLIGGAVHNVDPKGRVFIPSKFRMDLGSRFYACKWFDGCIRGYNEKEWLNFMDKIAKLPITANQVQREICQSTAELDMDVQGRVMLPEDLRRHAGITTDTKIIGMGEWVEFWNPATASGLGEGITAEQSVEHLAAVGIR